MWIAIIMTVIVGYLLGNLNGAVIMSRLLAHEDVRQQGSGNAGLTNFARNYGGIGSLAVLLIDGAKAAAACVLGGVLLAKNGMTYIEGAAIGGLAVMLGHDFPVFLGFKGGKGILSGAVVALCVDWRVGLLVLGVFLALYLLTQYVSLGSVMGATAFGIGFVVLHYDRPVVAVCGGVMGALAVFMHRGNIARLIKGQERKTNLFGKGQKK